MYEEVLWIFRRVRNEDKYFIEKMKLLTKEQLKSYGNTKICYISKQKIENKYVKDKKYRKVWDHHCLYTGKYVGDAHSIVV